MKKLILTSLLMLSSLSLNAVEIINNSSVPVMLTDFTFISGIEIGMYPITLVPGEKYEHSGIASCNIYFKEHKIKYKLKNLKSDTSVNCEMINGEFIVKVSNIEVIKPVFESSFEMGNTILKSEK